MMFSENLGSIAWPQHPQRTHVGAHWPSSVPGASVTLQGSGTTSAKTPEALTVRKAAVRTNTKRLNMGIVALESRGEATTETGLTLPPAERSIRAHRSSSAWR